MLYDLLSEPPEPGSVLEALCLMIQMRREATELYKNFAMLRAIQVSQSKDPSSAESVAEAFKTYRASLMPFLEREVTQEKTELIEALKREIAMNSSLAVQSVMPRKAEEVVRKRLEARPIQKSKWARKKRW